MLMAGADAHVAFDHKQKVNIGISQEIHSSNAMIRTSVHCVAFLLIGLTIGSKAHQCIMVKTEATVAAAWS